LSEEIVRIVRLEIEQRQRERKGESYGGKGGTGVLKRVVKGRDRRCVISTKNKNEERKK